VPTFKDTVALQPVMDWSLHQKRSIKPDATKSCRSSLSSNPELYHEYQGILPSNAGTENVWDWSDGESIQGRKATSVDSFCFDHPMDRSHFITSLPVEAFAQPSVPKFSYPFSNRYLACKKREQQGNNISEDRVQDPNKEWWAQYQSKGYRIKRKPLPIYHACTTSPTPSVSEGDLPECLWLTQVGTTSLMVSQERSHAHTTNVNCQLQDDADEAPPRTVDPSLATGRDTSRNSLDGVTNQRKRTSREDRRPDPEAIIDVEDDHGCSGLFSGLGLELKSTCTNELSHWKSYLTSFWSGCVSDLKELYRQQRKEIRTNHTVKAGTTKELLSRAWKKSKRKLRKRRGGRTTKRRVSSLQL
jgi:hypothetical protein